MMDAGLELTGQGLALQIGRGLLIGLLLWGVGRLIDIAPLPRARRRLLERLYPVFVIAVGTVFVGSAVQQLLGAHGGAMPIALGLVALGLGSVLWWPLRDLVAGVFLRAGNVVRPGDEVEVAGVAGQVERMGYRSMVVLAPHGEVVLPYAAMARIAIVRSRASQGTTTHVFKVEKEGDTDAMALRRAVTEGAMQCHWASVCRPPRIRGLEGGALEVVVYAVGEGFGPAIEAAVRARVARLTGVGGGQGGEQDAHAAG